MGTLRLLIIAIGVVFATCGGLPAIHADAGACDCPYAEDHLEILKKDIVQLQLQAAMQETRIAALESMIKPNNDGGGK